MQAVDLISQVVNMTVDVATRGDAVSLELRTIHDWVIILSLWSWRRLSWLFRRLHCPRIVE
eukprot:9478489-Pyramimonas_sp.AAC.1